MKKYYVIVAVIAILITCIVIINIGIKRVEPETVNQEESDEDDYIVIGFSQLGAESDWRTANTESIREMFTEENGFELIIENGQQKQSNQITAIRSFIQQEVDIILLAPVVEKGWDSVLQEAREAGIPVILVDNKIDTRDPSLYVAHVGSDFILQADKVMEWFYEYTSTRKIPPDQINIVDIQGTNGSTAQIERTRSLYRAVYQYGWNLLAQESGDFTQAKGKEIMKDLLHRFPKINVVYCDNDSTAAGAIEAIEESGRKVGKDIFNDDIMILTFGGQNQLVMDYVRGGKIPCVAEHNPNQGIRILNVMMAISEGGLAGKHYYTKESLYSGSTIVKSITINKVEYPVTILWKAGQY